MDKVFLVKLKGIHKDYQNDVDSELNALLTEVVEFAEEVEIEELEE